MLSSSYMSTCIDLALNASAAGLVRDDQPMGAVRVAESNRSSGRISTPCSVWVRVGGESGVCLPRCRNCLAFLQAAMGEEGVLDACAFQSEIEDEMAVERMRRAQVMALQLRLASASEMMSPSERTRLVVRLARLRVRGGESRLSEELPALESDASSV